MDRPLLFVWLLPSVGVSRVSETPRPVTRIHCSGCV